MGPIVGVYSTDCSESIKVYEGRTRICDWKFIFREERGAQARGGAQPQPTVVPDDGLPFGHRRPGDRRPQRTPDY
jgi:hypothetical protein